MDDAWRRAGREFKEEILSSWALGDEMDAKEWVEELGKLKIRSFETLEQVASNQDSWNQLCQTISLVLREKLRYWRNSKVQIGKLVNSHQEQSSVLDRFSVRRVFFFGCRDSHNF
jgi:hypothetical protein